MLKGAFVLWLIVEGIISGLVFFLSLFLWKVFSYAQARISFDYFIRSA